MHMAKGKPNTDENNKEKYPFIINVFYYIQNFVIPIANIIIKLCL